MCLGDVEYLELFSAECGDIRRAKNLAPVLSLVFLHGGELNGDGRVEGNVARVVAENGEDDDEDEGMDGGYHGGSQRCQASAGRNRMPIQANVSVQTVLAEGGGANLSRRLENT
jgi:hypothetical protein